MSTWMDTWKDKVAIFRSRFIAREDVFSIRKEYKIPERDEAGNITGYKDTKSIRPKCQNDTKFELCLILQKKGGCSECSNQLRTPLSDEWIARHLSGDTEIILYMLRAEGIKFGCADFDKGNTLDDAKKVRELSLSMGLPCYIAKSTKKGYHLYWFFDEYIGANVFNSFIRHLFETLGFYQRFFDNPEIGIPEVFPKQTAYDNVNMGNGIKVPMMAPRVAEGRNCWIDENDNPIDTEKQWEYLKNTQLVSVEKLHALIAEKGIEIYTAPASKSKQMARKMEGILNGEEEFVPYHPHGNFFNIIEGCPAMREYWAKTIKGNEYLWDKSNPKGLFNAARLASMNIALSTLDGEDIIKKRWPTKATENQIKSAKAKGYLPVTCRWMQENNICHKNRHPKFGDHCLKKIPPVEYENGERIVNPDNLPEEEWSEPSPIRYANDNHLSADEIIERFAMIHKSEKSKTESSKIEIDAATGHPKITVVFYFTDPKGRKRQLRKRSRFLGETEFAYVTSQILDNKYVTKTELKEIDKVIDKELGEEKDKRKQETSRSIVFAGSQYFEENGKYVHVWRDAKGGRMEEDLTNFTVQITEEIETIKLKDNDDLAKNLLVEDREYLGHISVENVKVGFKASHDRWGASADSIFKELTKNAGVLLLYRRSNFDHIRNCINAFSKKERVVRRKVTQIGHHTLDGNSIYLTPSVVVHKDEIKENTDYIIEFKSDMTQGLDFQLITTEDLKNVSAHIIKDFFGCNNAMLTMTAFAHAMAATMIPQVADAVGYNKSPILWLTGGFGGGKSFVAENAQWFFGRFYNMMSAQGSAKAKTVVGHHFRHAMFVVDDFKKALHEHGAKDFNKFIQSAYDRKMDPALQRNGKEREELARVRGLILVTGEETTDNEASAISRLIIVDTKLTENREAGAKVLENRHLYSGFTPYFIQFVYNLSKQDISSVWKKYYAIFNNESVNKKHKRESSGRVCENLTLNMMAFQFAMDMMVAQGAIPEVMREEMLRVHLGNLQMVRSTIFKAIESAKGVEVFLEYLRELLQNPTKYTIEDWPTDKSDSGEFIDTKNAIKLGFYKAKVPDTIYIYPSVAYREVANLAKAGNSYIQSVPHIARQMHEEGYLVAEQLTKDGRFTKQLRGPTGTNVKAWPLKAEQLGLLVEKNAQNAPLKNYAITQKEDDNDADETYF